MITEKERTVCEELDWRVYEYEDGDIELESYSPKGENIVFTIYKDEVFLEGVLRIYMEFDVDEHAEMWISHRGRDGVPATISAILYDAEEIEKMLEELFQTLKKEDGENE